MFENVQLPIEDSGAYLVKYEENKNKKNSSRRRRRHV
jgi:hypothetical protein